MELRPFGRTGVSVTQCPVWAISFPSCSSEWWPSSCSGPRRGWSRWPSRSTFHLSAPFERRVEEVVGLGDDGEVRASVDGCLRIGIHRDEAPCGTDRVEIPLLAHADGDEEERRHRALEHADLELHRRVAALD